MSDADVELFLWKFKKDYVINSFTKHADNIVISIPNDQPDQEAETRVSASCS